MTKEENEIELYDYLGEYENSSSDEQLRLLKEFLLLSGKYTKLLQNGIKIQYIFREVANEYKLKYVDKYGIYHYTYDEKKRLCQSEMTPWDKEAVDKHIYAMAYALEMVNLGKNTCRVEIINEKIKEMKRNAMDKLFFYDLVYFIRKNAGLYIKDDKEAEERIEIIKNGVDNDKTAVFNAELYYFIKKVAYKAKTQIDDINNLPKYRYIVDDELEEYKQYIK